MKQRSASMVHLTGDIALIVAAAGLPVERMICKQFSLARWFGVALFALTASAQSVGSGHARPHSLAAGKPMVDLTLPAESTDFTQAFTRDLNVAYDQHLASKTKIESDYNVQFSMPVSVFGQWGTPNGGPGVAELVYSPSVTWTPFSDTGVGSGAFNFAFQANQFWSLANTNSQQSSIGLITPPNDWGADSCQYVQITYTHTLPGEWLAVSIGQYSIGLYDGNQYAGDAQANFINYASRPERHANLCQRRSGRLRPDRAEQPAADC
jgi:hypothetical protein